MNGKIYMIKSPQTNMCYIGSTKQTLEKRLKQHCNAYNCWSKNNDKHYCTAYDVIKFENPYITLLEELENVTKQQLCRKEGEYIRNTMHCVNQIIAGRTRKECYETNKEKYKNKMKEYNQLNRDKIKETRRLHNLERRLHNEEIT